jgi:Polyketide cyclase / dehydrase and lipid transport
MPPGSTNGGGSRRHVGLGADDDVSATPDEVFDFVLDLHRYRQADHKVGRVGTIHHDGDRGTAQFSGRIRGLPAPSGTYPFTRTDSRPTFGSPIAGPAWWFINFEGTFDTERTPDGTVVTHREAFSFKRPCQWLAETLLRSWLEKDTTEEMVRFKQLIERVDDEPASEQ